MCHAKGNGKMDTMKQLPLPIENDYRCLFDDIADDWNAQNTLLKAHNAIGLRVTVK